MAKRSKAVRATVNEGPRAYFNWEKPLYSSNSQFAIDLRQALSTMRIRLKPILDSISIHLPGLTDHSLLHIDNLRRLTNELIRDNVLSVAEVYCLNVAFLIHDACLSPLLFSGGPTAVRQSDIYLQQVALHLRNRRGIASETSIVAYLAEHSDHVKDPLFFAVLRKTHATEAASILERFHLKNDDGNSVYLIDNQELRIFTSNICGPIAASHHLPHGELEAKMPKDRVFPRMLGMHGEVGADLQVRDFYLAIILRVVDACQLEGRAPHWYRLLKEPAGVSRLHWDFQEAFTLSYEHDQIFFQAFLAPCPLSRAPAWWMAYDYLHDFVGPELGAADRYMRERNYPAFRRSKAGNISGPQNFRERNPTAGWEPVDVKPAIRNPLRVMELLGGEMLYGSDPHAPVRELIQNALDATDALQTRRKMSQFESPPIEIEVSTSGDAVKVQIRDQGIGMTKYVLTEVLPDFGRSVWSSDDEKTDAAALLQKGLQPRGRYGIGFYSIFMIGDGVRIATKPDADEGSHALDFIHGLGQRPLLTPLDMDERARLKASGTEVSFALRKGLESFESVKVSEKPISIYEHFSSLDAVTRYIVEICPLVNRELIVRFNGDTARLPVLTMEQLKNDWQLFNQRVLGSIPESDGSYAHCQFLFENLVEIRDDEQNLLGLVAPNLPDREHPLAGSGVVVDGGLRVETVPTFFGIAHGDVLKADRAAAQSALKRANAASKQKIVDHFKAMLAIQNGKCDLRKVKSKVASIKDIIVAELLPFDPEFSAALTAKKSKQQGNDRLSDWLSLMRRHGRLIFFVPELTAEESYYAKYFPFAYPMFSLPIFSRGSMIALELLGAGHESIAKWMADYFSKELKQPVTHRFGRPLVGQTERKVPVYNFGIQFLLVGKAENVSPADLNIAEMYELYAADFVPDA